MISFYIPGIDEVEQLREYDKVPALKLKFDQGRSQKDKHDCVVSAVVEIYKVCVVLCTEKRAVKLHKGSIKF